MLFKHRGAQHYVEGCLTSATVNSLGLLSEMTCLFGLAGRSCPRLLDPSVQTLHRSSAMMGFTAKISNRRLPDSSSKSIYCSQRLQLDKQELVRDYFIT